jgi:O-antigen/teichoic acid export membrane protein
MRLSLSPGVTDLLGSTAIYAGANAVSAAIPFLLLPVLTRALTPADFGRLAMFSVTQSALLPLVGLSTKTAISRRWFDGDGDMSSFVTTCLAIATGSSALVALGLWGFASAVTAVTQLSIGWLFVALVATMAQFIIFIQLSLWQARRLAWRYGTFQVTQAAIYASLTLVWVVGLGKGWPGQAAAQAATLVAFAAIALATLGRARDLAWPPRGDQMRQALAFGLPLVPHGLSGVALGVFDRFLIANALDVHEAGLYTAALQISMVLSLLVNASNRAYMPRLFAELARDDGRRRAREVRHAYVYFAVLAGAAVVVGQIAPPLATIVLGEAFHESAAFIPWLAAGVAVGGMYNIAAYHLIFARRTGWLTLASLGSACVHVTMSTLLVHHEGTIGAAHAFVLSQTCLFGLAWSLARRTAPAP